MKKHSQADPDIINLITTLTEHLASLERKVDTLISRSLPGPVENKPNQQPYVKPFQRPANNFSQSLPSQGNRFQSGNRRDNSQRERVMHKAICADCKKQCEVPFRPVEGRLVYCQLCFSRRRSGSSFRGNFDNKPREAFSTPTAAVPSANISTHGSGVKNRLVTKKKSVIKKKPLSKKRKK